ncbi:hypothetical protein [Flavobacterium pallidum]|uniref:hypothetical protein n=1 Tax=Flavobacterium pallidum TaxID=2172098 RepID=UPI0015E81E57|nr:hypothetical protein [Flavobacterium pallidum]
MKREYFGMLFIIIFTGILILSDYLFGGAAWDYFQKYIVIWVLIAFYAGQYSMKFPKAF